MLGHQALGTSLDEKCRTTSHPSAASSLAHAEPMPPLPVCQSNPTCSLLGLFSSLLCGKPYVAPVTSASRPWMRLSTVCSERVVMTMLARVQIAYPAALLYQVKIQDILAFNEPYYWKVPNSASMNDTDRATVHRNLLAELLPDNPT